MIDPAVAALAERWGVLTGYWDVSGHWFDADPDALIAVLQELGAPVTGPADADAASAAHERALWATPVEPVMVVPHGATLAFVLRLPSDAPTSVDLVVTTEAGAVRTAHVDAASVIPYAHAEVDGVAHVERWLDTGIDLPVGYHRVVVEVAGTESEALVVAPPPGLPSSPTVGCGGSSPPPTRSSRPDGRASTTSASPTSATSTSWVGAATHTALASSRPSRCWPPSSTSRSNPAPTHR